MKGYKYTLLRQDGALESLGGGSKPMPLEAIYRTLNCSTIEVVPIAYYPDDLVEVFDTAVREGRRLQITIYVDEEGRFKSLNQRNPYFKILDGEYDVVGDALLEEFGDVK